MIDIIIITFFTFIYYLFFIHSIISDYMKIHKEGEIVKKFKNARVILWIISQMLFLFIGLISLIVSGFNLYTPISIIVIFVFLLNRKVIVTNLGFYGGGKYIRWEKVLRIEEDRKENIIVVMDYVGVEKPLFLKSELKIGKLKNQKEFIQLANMYIRKNS